MDGKAREPRTDASGEERRINELQQAIDDRDETIRLLNEALSRALDELDEAGRAAA
jgi:hypothetical protein